MVEIYKKKIKRCSYFVFVAYNVYIGLGLAYAGTLHADVTSLLLPVMSDKKSTQEVTALAAISCGMINVASGNHEVVSTILQTLLELSPTELNDGTYCKFFPLALGLLYLGIHGLEFLLAIFANK